MNARMITLCISALVLILAGSASATVLVDQSDYQIPFNAGFFNCVAGAAPFGVTAYSVNDITVDGGGWAIDSITIYVNALGSYPDEVSYAFVNIFPKDGPLPVEIPNQDTMVPVTVTSIDGENFMVTASGLGIELEPGEYWIGLAPMASSFNYGVHIPCGTLVGDDTPTYDTGGWPAPMWMSWVPGVDAAILIEGDDNVVSSEKTSLDELKALYR